MMAGLLTGFGILGFAAVAALLLPPAPRIPVVSIAGALGCAALLVTSASVLVNGHSVVITSSAVVPLFGVQLTIDALGALFMAMASFVGCSAFIYLGGYARHELRTRTFLVLFTIFVGSLVAVPAASSIATFMFAWETMAVSSTLLIFTEHQRRPSASAAAQWYGVMTQFGAASILLGLLIAAWGSKPQFAAMALHASSLSPAVRSSAFLLVLIGFASKAGAVPLHVWLPKAHPQAPSPVSALMSSVMVALGVYGIIRVGMGVLHGGSWWWWLMVMGLGITSALFGALHASTNPDLKVLLAYSTIDIVGVVLIALGAAGALSLTGESPAARLALMGSLFLLAAHAGFKGILFLGAGSVEQATGTRNLDDLGGLIHLLPKTATMFAVGAFSIMAMPALSGFSAEWLALEGLIHGFGDSRPLILIFLLFGTATLALTGGLTAVTFVKAFGIGFLGRPRAIQTGLASEAPWPMVMAMALLAVPCVLLGVAPGWGSSSLQRSMATLGIGRKTIASGSGLRLVGFHGAITPLGIVTVLVVVAVLARVLVSSSSSQSVRRVPAWRGGGETPTARMQYSATSYAEPLERVFADVLRPSTDVEVTHEVESHFYEETLRFEHQHVDVLERFLYRPLISVTRLVGVTGRRLQNGSIHRYLAFGFLALLLVIVVFL